MKNHRIQTLFTLTLLTIAWLVILPQAGAEAILWSQDTPFTSAMTMENAPAMVQAPNKRVFMFWHSNPDGNYDIFYNYSDGANWSQATRFTTNPSVDANPAAVTTGNGKIWVFWVSERIGPAGNTEIFYKTSSNNGRTWTYDEQLTWNVYKDQRPSVMQDNDGRIWVVWSSNRGGNFDIWYNTYETSWGLPRQLTFDANPDTDACILQDDFGKIWVFWSADRTGDYALYYKTSVDYGAHWSAEAMLTTPPNNYWDEYPSVIQAQNGTIWLVWMRGGAPPKDHDIYYKTYVRSRSPQWSTETAIVTDAAEDKQPTIFQAANTTMWIAWASSRLGDYDIFYKATITEHDVVVTNVTPTVNAYQGFQSPIKVTVKNCGELYSETFAVTAYYGSTPIGTETVLNLAPNVVKTLTFNWSTTDVPFGYYTNLWSASASQVLGEKDFTDNSLTNGTVLLTIPGDVNGDRLIDIADKGKVSAHWSDFGSPPGSLGYAEVADINYDGFVNIGDVAIINANWDRSW